MARGGRIARVVQLREKPRQGRQPASADRSEGRSRRLGAQGSRDRGHEQSDQGPLRWPGLARLASTRAESVVRLWVVGGSALVAVGLGVAVLTGPGPLTRMLGAVGAVAVARLHRSAPAPHRRRRAPVYFSANLRYVSVGIALGLVLLPLSPLFARRALAWCVPAVCLAIVVVMQLDPTLWPTELRDLRWEQPVRGADVVAGLVAGLLVLTVGVAYVRGRYAAGAELAQPRCPATEPDAILVSIGIAHGRSRGRAIQWFLAHRYALPDALYPFVPVHWESWKWARDTHDERIGYTPPALCRTRCTATACRTRSKPFRERNRCGRAAHRPGRVRRLSCTTVNQRKYTYVVLFGSLAPITLGCSGRADFEQTTPESRLARCRSRGIAGAASAVRGGLSNRWSTRPRRRARDRS